MKKESWSVGWACAIGAFVGTIAALEISSWITLGPIFRALGAFFGALLGGGVGYLMVDFRKLVSGMRRAWHDVVNWRPDWPYWKMATSLFCGMWVMSATVIGAILAISVISPTLDYATHSTWPYSYPLLVVVILVLVTMLSLFTVFSLGKIDPNTNRASHLKFYREFGWKMFKINPIYIPYKTFYWTFRGLAWSIVKLPRLVVIKAPIALGRLIILLRRTLLLGRTAFIYVHTYRRTLCFVDATIGASIGYFSGSALVGAVAGALLGVLNYELVSVRWLKLVPAKQSTAS